MWKYGLKHKIITETDSSTYDWYEITEIYSQDCYTGTSLILSAETPQEIIDTLQLMLKDLTEPTIIEETT